MPDLSWKDAIIFVLQQQRGEAMHYTDIAEAIAQQNLLSSSGATPALTVGSILAFSLKTDVNTPFIKAGRGRYALKDALPQAYETKSAPDPAATPGEEAGLINAFGVHWERRHVAWNKYPQLLGRQPGASINIDFCMQRGVYILYDRQRVIYVGRADRDSLGQRLRAHTADRFAARWDRFSWFGVYPPRDNGLLDLSVRVRNGDIAMLIATMEALLIESLEPPQNRKRGDDMRAVEFWQVRNPDLKKKEVLEMALLLKEQLAELKL